MKSRRRIPGRLPRARSLAAGLLCALLAALLGACSSLGGEPSEDLARAVPRDQVGPAYLMTVDLTKGDTRGEILQRHGGEIVVWAEDSFAVLGFDSDSAPERGRGKINLLGSRGTIAEPNSEFATGANVISMEGTSGLWAGGTSTMWAGGTSYIWAGGTSTLWAGGTSWLWAGGEFSWMPQNTAVWQQIGLDEAHSLASPTLGFQVKVAVIDTGLDLDHPAFVEAVEPGKDYVDDDDDPREEGPDEHAGYGHGTNVAGIIRQIAPRATIVPIRVLDEHGSGDAADLAAAVVEAVDAGVHVINLSLGSASHVHAVDAALRYAAAHGVYVVTSTGDSGDSRVTYPASDAATGLASRWMVSLTSVNGDDIKSEFSPFHAQQVELSAPGEYIYAPAPDLRLAAWSGTSMSAPMATGALALALGAAGEAGLRVPEGQLTAALLKSSTNIDHLNDLEYQRKLGEGRLRIDSFLEDVLISVGGG